MVAPGLGGDAWVSGAVPVVRVEAPGLVPFVVPSVWLGFGVLPGTPELVGCGAVVSRGDVGGSADVPVCGAVVGGEGRLLPGGVLGVSGVEDPFSGLEAVPVEAVVGGSAVVSVDFREAERAEIVVAFRSSSHLLPELLQPARS